MFQKGNKFGKGCPTALKMHEYSTALFKAVGKKKFKDLVDVIYHKAMNGDMIAAKLLVERLCGKLKETQEIQVSNNDNTKEIIITVKQNNDNKSETKSSST